MSASTKDALAGGTAAWGMHVPSGAPPDCAQQVAPPVALAVLESVPLALALVPVDDGEVEPVAAAASSALVPASATLPALYVDVVGLAKVQPARSASGTTKRATAGRWARE